MRAIVHIGATKTGSTSLQGFFNLNREGLSAQGVRYWSSDSADGSSASLATAALARIGRRVPSARARAKLGMQLPDAQSSKVDTVLASLVECVQNSVEPLFLVSSEHLSAWLGDVDAIKALDDMLGEHFEQVDYIIYYIRHQRELALSQYSQRVKGGLALTFDQMLDRSIERLDHNATVQTWLRAVDRERFHLRLLDTTEMVNGNLFDDFCRMIGVDVDGLARTERRNESMSAASLELARRVNAVTPVLGEDKSINADRAALIRRAAALGKDLPKLGLTSEQSSRIDAAVAESNEALRAAFFPHRDTLFAPARGVTPVDASGVVSEALDLAVLLVTDRYEKRKPMKTPKRPDSPTARANRQGRRKQNPNRAPDGV